VILFVVNENSGNGRGRSTWFKVESALLARGTAYVKVVERTQPEAIDQVRQLLAQGNLKAVTVVGGDGSLHGILPLLAGTGIPYGLIPSGSGNDTSRTLGIPSDPIKALDLILGGHTRTIDLLETLTDNGERQYTITAVAIGLDGTVADDVNRSTYKKWCNRLGVGSLAYVIGLFRALAKFKPREITVTMDGKTQVFQRAWMSAVANVASYGGGLQICPDARADDGKLHVCIVHNCGILRILQVFPSLLNGTHVNKKRYITILKGDIVRIESSGAMLAFGDGEPSGVSPLTATIRSRQLVFLVAASG
jgi:YegS/Rv2252/BmrU family lipid kinase